MTAANSAILPQMGMVFRILSVPMKKNETPMAASITGRIKAATPISPKNTGASFARKPSLLP